MGCAGRSREMAHELALVGRTLVEHIGVSRTSLRRRRGGLLHTWVTHRQCAIGHRLVMRALLRASLRAPLLGNGLVWRVRRYAQYARCGECAGMLRLGWS